MAWQAVRGVLDYVYMHPALADASGPDSIRCFGLEIWLSRYPSRHMLGSTRRTVRSSSLVGIATSLHTILILSLLYLMNLLRPLTIGTTLKCA